MLPTRFGCVFASEQALEGVIGQHRELIGQFLSEVADQEEWTLKAFYDENQVVTAMLQTDPELSARFGKLPTARRGSLFSREEAPRGGTLRREPRRQGRCRGYIKPSTRAGWG